MRLATPSSQVLSVLVCSVVVRSFIPKRDVRIQPGGAPRWNPGREGGDQREQHRHRGERRRIGRRHAHQQARHHARQRDRGDHAEHDAADAQPQALADDQRQDAAAAWRRRPCARRSRSCAGAPSWRARRRGRSSRGSRRPPRRRRSGSARSASARCARRSTTATCAARSAAGARSCCGQRAAHGAGDRVRIAAGSAPPIGTPRRTARSRR